MTNLIIKGNRYRLVDNRSFDLPLPVKYVVLKEDMEVAEYEVCSDEEVNYKILTKYKENMITPITRPLTIADVYYFFSCRVFQDKTPFTGLELSLLGLEKYNVYDIIRKTRGVTPYDTYWVRFDGDDCDYEKAKKTWDELMSNVSGAAKAEPPMPAAAAPETPAPPKKLDRHDPGINEILHQQKVDISAKFAEHEAEVKEEAEAEANPVPENSTMTTDEIEALLAQVGLDDSVSAVPEAHKTPDGNIPTEDITKMLEEANSDTPAPVTASGGNMSPEDIAKLLADSGNDAEAEPAEDIKNIKEEIKEEIKDEAAKMSEEDIAKMLAAVEAEAPANAALVDEAPADDLASAEELIKTDVPVSEDDLPSAEEAAVPMSEEDIAKMLNEQVTAVQEPIDINAPAEAEAAIEAPMQATPDDAPGGEEKLSAEEIEALLGGMKKDAQT